MTAIPDANGWMPIETAPTTPYFRALILTGEPHVGERDEDGQGWKVLCGSGCCWSFESPTHWQPLPGGLA